jgi:hypothetical protein
MKRFEPIYDDVIVLLGAEVHRNFILESNRIIKVAHPSSKRSHKEMDEFVSTTVAKIECCR